MAHFLDAVDDALGLGPLQDVAGRDGFDGLNDFVFFVNDGEN